MSRRLVGLSIGLAIHAIAGCGRIAFDETTAPDPVDNTDPIVQAYVDEVMADGPLAYWRFEALSVADETGNGHDGEFRGDVALDVGLLGDGARFGSGGIAAPTTGGRFVGGQSFFFADRAPFSLECWMREDAIVDEWHVLFSTDYWDMVGRQGYTVEHRADHIHLMRRRDSGDEEAYAYGALVAQRWQHVVGTYDGADMRLYLNGALEMQTSSTNMILLDVTLANRFTISDAEYTIRGVVDECAVYGAALAPERIAAHYATLAMN
jgi:hypothetical protein